MFQPPVPVSKVLANIHTKKYVLPAIQREFVWGTNQIRSLFDSLMRGYPIGAFLFWNVDEAHVGEFAFYEFITDYHERKNPYAPVAHVANGKGITAILDGQQRLTALNIGLYGSHAERQPRKWWTNPDAFPTKRLHLNLVDEVDDEELGLSYDFRFLTDAEAKPGSDGISKWFKVRKVLDLADSGPAIMEHLESRDLSGKVAFNRLYALYRAVREEPVVNAYLEESQDPNKVLDIFVRVNSGGTTLSYSDLLLSMATNQWKELDAREQVRSLVSDLNDLPAAFGFNKDLILKAGLVLIDVPDIGFKVSNFTQANMLDMEKKWPQIRTSLVTAAELLSSFGYSGRTLTAASVMIPVAYYIHQRSLGPEYVVASSHATDRLQMKQWITRSQMKRGIWGSGLDTLLGRLRESIRLYGDSGFPRHELETAMAGLGKSLSFEEAEIDDLLDLKFGSARVFPVLATLYPGLDLAKTFHEDHIYPKSRFSRAKLAKAGIENERIDDYLDKVNRLPNLQLLSGIPNIEKQAKLPHEWLHGPHFPTDEARAQYVNDNDLGAVADLDSFLEFFDARRGRMEARLRLILGVGGVAEPGEEE